MLPKDDFVTICGVCFNTVYASREEILDLEEKKCNYCGELIPMTKFEMSEIDYGEISY